MCSTRSSQGNIRYIPPFLGLERDSRPNLLAVQLEYLGLSRGTSDASIDPAVRHGIRADVVSMDGYGYGFITY